MKRKILRYLNNNNEYVKNMLSSLTLIMKRKCGGRFYIFLGLFHYRYAIFLIKLNNENARPLK